MQRCSRKHSRAGLSCTRGPISLYSATDGSFASKHGRHVIGHIDDYSALREQIGEGRLLVKKIASLLRPTCSFSGLEAPGIEVITF